MGQPRSSPLGKMYQEHIGFINARNLEGLLGQYAENCLLISTLTESRQPLYVRGRGELRQFFENRIFNLDDLKIEITQWAETESTLMVVEDVRAVAGARPTSAEFYDNWYLKNGKIAIHFAGTVRYPDGTYADGTGFSPGAAPKKHEPPDTPLGRLYSEHIRFIKAKNVEGILHQYGEDALLIGTLTPGRKPRFVRGRLSLRDFFTTNFINLKALTSRIDQWAEAENALMIVESVDVVGMDDSKADMSFYDNWVLEKGKIVVHFAGVVRYPDGTYA